MMWIPFFVYILPFTSSHGHVPVHSRNYCRTFYVCALIFQIPICLVRATLVTPTAKNRDLEDVETIFPCDEDIGLPWGEFPIVVVYNGLDHYTGTQLLKEDYKDLSDDLIDNLTQCLATARLLGDSTQDEEVKKHFLETSKYIKTASYTTLNLVKNLLQHGQGKPPVIRRKSKDTTETRKFKSKMTDFHCSCGKLKSSEDTLLAHKQKRHSNSNWNCSGDGCETVCSTAKALKRHFRNIHLKEFTHTCMYCPFGRDTKFLVANHMAEKHSMIKKFACDECNKAFATNIQLSKHKGTHLGLRPFICQFCHKKYASNHSKLFHEAVEHTKTIGKMECPSCKKTYRSKTSFKAHYKTKCIDMVEVPMEEGLVGREVESDAGVGEGEEVVEGGEVVESEGEDESEDEEDDSEDEEEEGGNQPMSRTWMLIKGSSSIHLPLNNF